MNVTQVLTRAPSKKPLYPFHWLFSSTEKSRINLTQNRIQNSRFQFSFICKIFTCVKKKLTCHCCWSFMGTGAIVCHCDLFKTLVSGSDNANKRCLRSRRWIYVKWLPLWKLTSSIHYLKRYLKRHKSQWLKILMKLSKMLSWTHSPYKGRYNLLRTKDAYFCTSVAWPSGDLYTWFSRWFVLLWTG